jgi:hypothetical protein
VNNPWTKPISLQAKNGEKLKGVWHEILPSGSSHESVSPGPLSISLGPFRILWKFAEILTTLKWPQWDTQGPRGDWFMKKAWSRKSHVRLPLKINVQDQTKLLCFNELVICSEKSLKRLYAFQGDGWRNSASSGCISVLCAVIWTMRNFSSFIIIRSRLCWVINTSTCHTHMYKTVLHGVIQISSKQALRTLIIPTLHCMRQVKMLSNDAFPLLKT